LRLLRLKATADAKRLFATPTKSISLHANSSNAIWVFWVKAHSGLRWQPGSLEGRHALLAWLALKKRPRTSRRRV